MWKPGWIFLCNACGSVKEFTVSAEYSRGNCPGFFACFYLLYWLFNIRFGACVEKVFCKMCITLCEKAFLCVLELLELGARFALHMPGKNYIMKKWTKKSESTNT